MLEIPLNVFTTHGGPRPHSSAEMLTHGATERMLCRSSMAAFTAMVGIFAWLEYSIILPGTPAGPVPPIKINHIFILIKNATSEKKI